MQTDRRRESGRRELLVTRRACGPPRRAACLLALGVATAIFASMPVAGQEAGKKYALLIGISKYVNVTEGIVQLNYADDDVRDLSSALEAQGYEVTVLPNELAIRERIIGKLYYHAAITTKDDTFLLFFSGHGVRNDPVNGKTYWLTHEARLSPLDDEGIRIEHLLEYVHDIRAGRKLVLLDHCFSGAVVDVAAPAAAPPAGAGGGAIARTVGEGRRIDSRGAFRDNDWYKEIQPQAEGLVVLAAAKNRAFESSTLGHGLFTEALLRALGSREADTAPRDGRLSAKELVAFVKEKVKQLAADENLPQQVPEDFESGRNLGDWEIAGSLPAADADEAREKVDDYRQTLDRWELREWITLKVKRRCKELLDAWVLSIAPDGAELDDEAKRFVGVVRSHLDAYLADPSNVSEENALARDLEETIGLIVDDGQGGGQ